MDYLVKMTPRAERDLADLFQEINAAKSESAFHWYEGLRQAIRTLAQHPNRCSMTRRRNTIRQLLYGDKPNVYRVIFRILQKQKTVHVLHIRHGARRSAFGIYAP